MLGRTGNWAGKRLIGVSSCTLDNHHSWPFTSTGAKCGTNMYNRGAGAIYCGLAYTHTGYPVTLGASVVAGGVCNMLVRFTIF